MGIKKGDIIELTSPVGSIKAEAHMTAGINPQVLAISDSCGHWEYGNVAQARKFKSKDPFTSLIWWEDEGNGTHPNSIITIASAQCVIHDMSGPVNVQDGDTETYRCDNTTATLYEWYSDGNIQKKQRLGA